MDLITWMISTVHVTVVLVMVTVISNQLSLTSAKSIGVCYGTLGNNLPTPQDVINLYKSKQIEMVRLFDPKPEILQALRGSNIKVSVGIKNQDLASISSNQDAANAWVQTNIVPYKDDVSFGWITAGNEVIPGPLSHYVFEAMNNIQNAILAIGLQDRIKVTTVISGAALETSFPPSHGAFTADSIDVMRTVGGWLRWSSGGAPLMVNVYPYFAYANDPTDISLDYALFNSNEAVVIDGNFSYYNLFDAMVDAFNAALEKINLPNVKLSISESGWPSAGNEPYTSKYNAQTYNAGLMRHVLNVQGGTPRRPDHHYDTFMFAMFNEDLKPAGVEQNFGFFYPNMEPVYSFW